MKLPFVSFFSSRDGEVVEHNNLSGSNVFFGTGLVSGRGITDAVPLDFLEFLNSARQMRSLMGGKIIHILADSIAEKVTPVEKREELLRATQKCEGDFLNLYKKLGIEDQVVLLKSSEIENEHEYQSIFSEIDIEKLGVPEASGTYVKGQIALMEYMRVKMQCATKISWAVDLTVDEKRDEDFFDRFYEKQFGRDKLIFYYGKAGQTLDGTRPRVPPYVMLRDEKDYRLAVDSTSEDVEGFFAKMDSMTGRSARKRVREMEGKLSRIISTQEAFNGELNGSSLKGKIQDLVSKINVDGFSNVQPNKLVIFANPDAVPVPFHE